MSTRARLVNLQHGVLVLPCIWELFAVVLTLTVSQAVSGLPSLTLGCHSSSGRSFKVACLKREVGHVTSSRATLLDPELPALLSESDCIRCIGQEYFTTWLSSSCVPIPKAKRVNTALRRIQAFWTGFPLDWLWPGFGLCEQGRYHDETGFGPWRKILRVLSYISQNLMCCSCFESTQLLPASSLCQVIQKSFKMYALESH